MDGFEIGDVVTLSSKPGEPTPAGPGVIVGYLVHYPSRESIAAFQDDFIFSVDDQNIDSELRGVKDRLVHEAKADFGNAIAGAVRAFRDQVLGGRNLLEQGEKFLPKLGA